MLRIVIILICLAVLTSMTGCCTNPPVVTKTVYKVVETPETLLIKCGATAPPDKEKFKAMSDVEQKKVLTDLSNDLYGDLAKCNGQIKSIDDYQKKEKASVEKANKEAAK